MPSFGRASRNRLATCHDDLQRLFGVVVVSFDSSVLAGHRGQAEQDRLFAEGKSKLKYPDSKHNKYPSMAVDVAPCPVDWSDTSRFYYFAGFVKATALSMGITIRWGGDWNSNFVTNDQTFMDLPHYELV